MAAPALFEVLPPSLDSTSDPPPLFDGTTRLYITYMSPYAQRVWIARNYKGLHDKMKLVPIDLQNRPAWYKEKVSIQKTRYLFLMVLVPALEHNGQVIGESLDLVKYVDSNFEGPALLPDEPAKLKFAEELITYSDKFIIILYTSLKGDAVKEAVAEFDYLETALHKFDDGPFFLGQFSQVDAVYAPFLERFHMIFQEIFKHDIMSGRPKLAAWIEAINNIDAYKRTKCNPEKLLAYIKKRYLGES